LQNSSAPLEFTTPGLHHALCERIAKIDDLDRNRPVLDLGCGTGALLKRLHGIGFTNLVGVDRNPAQFVTGDIAQFVSADLNLDTPVVPNLPYGLVSAVEVIEHLEAPSIVMRCAATYLVPGGYLLLTSPNIYSVRIRARFFLTGRMPFFDVLADPHHLSPLLLTGIDKLVSRYSFDLIDLWTYPPHGSNGSRALARLLAKTLAWVVPNDFPGDNLCLLARRKG
jgi:SAM-dependent methyltransferase